MPAGPVGGSWASGSWSDTSWEANTWADGIGTSDPLLDDDEFFTVRAEDRFARVPAQDRWFRVTS